MKEKEELNLFDYLFIIWKRKVLIIAVTLVCIVIGVVIGLRLPVINLAEVIVRIGKGVSVKEIPTYLDTPENLITTIPIEYGSHIPTGYAVHVSTVKGTPLLRIMVKGPEAGKAKEFLEDITELLVKDHQKISEELITSYKVLASGIGKYIETVGNEIVQFGLSQERLNAEGLVIKKEVNAPDRMWEKRDSLIALKRESEYKMYVNSLRTNMTKIVGKIVVGEIPLISKKLKYIIFAGVFGLTISLFTVFFTEYMKNAMEVKER